ncbi:hypothetical protein CS022_04615 [Veronia nyctiphanis]|uniref:Uncharacterized protein n=2 Tax=Veronia nyctiphanis TaxID=1278244 RepID=A0A4V1LT87_9GAMM|nr:hypothetical protein CS022_04615 [Veronia nyctiphanis]
MTWGNLVIGAAIVMSESDQSISNYATQHNHLFGSKKRAAEVSDRARSTSRVSMLISSAMVEPDFSDSLDKTLEKKVISLN